LFLLTAGLLCAAFGLAQTTGGIAGWISDSLGAPLPGVTVGAVGVNLQGRRVVMTAKDGTYRLPALPPGQYTIRGSLPGFASLEKTVNVSVGATATVRLILQLELRESVVVSGDVPFVDTTTTTAARSYDSSGVIIHLPVDRNYADAAFTSPSVVTDEGRSQGRSLNLAVNGATSAESQWTIDGVNTTNVMRGVQGKAFNNEAIEAVDVATGGFQAEYGRSLGGVINVVTKSGGNAFHGNAFIYYDDSNIRADRVFVQGEDSPLSGMRLADYRRADYGASLGGFLLRDRLWFFAAYDRTSFPAEVSRLASSRLVPASERFPLSGTDELYSVKLTWNVASGSTLVATVFSDPTTNSGAGAADPRRESVVFRAITNPDAGTWEAQRSVGAADYGLRFGQVFGSAGFLSIQAARHQDRFRLEPTGTGLGVRTVDFTCTGGNPYDPCVPPLEENFSEGGFGDLGGPGNNSESYRNQIRADVNVYRGSHDIKLGADYQQAHTTALAAFSGDQLVARFNDQGTTYYEHQFWDPTASLTPATGILRGGLAEVGAYIQDSWSAAAGLTINAGLRWDQELLRDHSGTTAMRLTQEWQPRLGVAWDPWGDGATRIYAFAGRFYYSLPTELAVRSFGGIAARTTWNYDPVDVTPAEVPGRVNFPFGLSPSVAVDENLRGVSLDEFTAGVERLIQPSLSVGLKGTYRRLGNTVEDRCDLDFGVPDQPTHCAMTNPGGSEVYARGDFYSCSGLDEPATHRCGLPPHVYGAAAVPAARRLYRGIELLVRKTVGDQLWLQASYVYSSLRGNYDGAVNEGFGGQTSPGINVDFDYPQLLHNAYGRLYLDRPHDLRVSGFYRTPLRLSVGVQAYLLSGAPLEKFGYLNETYFHAIRLVPRGYAGRLPMSWDANLTLEYPVRIGHATLTLQGYVFNIFNNQIRTSQDMVWSSAPPPGYPDTIFDPNQEQTNPNYGQITKRQSPRLFRAAARVSF
jgi:Carboxypeptidase regulatory-like domain/TonB-dependent Receptor Plug Domain